MKNSWTIPSRLQRYLYKGHQEKAIAFLSRITSINQDNLFKDHDEEYLRFIGQYRIQYLMEIGYYREALAWACLECELYPDNHEAFAIKDSIKKQIINLPDKVPVRQVKAKTKWGPVAGMRSVKAMIERDFLMPLIDPEIFTRYKVNIPAGLLLYGPPGCGKTLFITQLAKILGFSFIEVLPSTLASIYVHGTQGKIKEIFQEAIEKGPSIIYFDEFDSLVPSRNKGDVSHHYTTETSEFLVQMDRAFKKGVLVFASTNYLNRLDPAVIRPGRIDKKIYIGPPDYEARIETFKHYLNEKTHHVTDFDYLGEETEYYTYAEIRAIVDEAFRLAHSESTTLGLNQLMKVVLKNPPYLNEEILLQYY
jgi:transitional endoplasmic reticulum ATPase